MKTINKDWTKFSYSEYDEWQRGKEWLKNTQVSYSPTAFVDLWEDADGVKYEANAYNGLCGRHYVDVRIKTKDSQPSWLFNCYGWLR